MSAALVNGWIEVPYTGPEAAVVELSIEPGAWLPAYLDHDSNGQRVAKVRPSSKLPSATVQVKLRVDGSVFTLGWLAIK